MILLPLLFGLCGCSYCVSAAAGLLSSFKNALGHDLVSVHVETEDELVHALQRQWDVINADSEKSRHQYIACTSSASLDALQSTLSESLNTLNYRVLAHSVHADSSCFILHATLGEISSVKHSGRSFLNMLHPIPVTMKIHPSSFFAMHLVDQNSKSASFSSPLFKMMSKQFDFKSSTLNVEFGLGGSASATDVSSAATSIRSKLSGGNHDALDVMSNFRYAGEKNVWSDLHTASSSVLKSIRGTEHCSYSALEFEEGRSGFVVRGLHRMLDSESTRSCFGNLVATLALERDILQVYLKPQDKILNDVEKSIIQAKTSTSNVHPYHSAGLNGTGQIIGVGDTGIDDLHCMFVNPDGATVRRSDYRSPTYNLASRKIVQYVAYANSIDTNRGHGSHVVGTAVGYDDSLSLYNSRGHASGAKVAFFDMSNDGEAISYPSPLSNYVFKSAYNTGARLHSNSWGSAFNDYTSTCADVDEYHYITDDFLALFAAGNDGRDGYYSVGAPATSKNSIAVGASKSSPAFGDIAYFSSMGPTFDNRFKPDVIAPGFSTASASANVGTRSCGLVSKAGTSMATPAVAGNAAIIRQFFLTPSFWAATCRSGYTKCGAFNPRGATVKAMLLHSGEPMTRYADSLGTTESAVTLGTTPDIMQGFGRIALPNVIPLSGTTVANFDLFVDELSMTSYTTRTYTVTVTSSTAPLKVTIAWMDPPASVLSQKLLIHDIDLKVIPPVGDTMYGNEFAGDENNNVEQVTITSPSAGVYSVVLTAKNIVSIGGYPNSDQQKISVIITSVGSVSGPSSGTVTSAVANFPLQCSAGQSQVTLVMTDQGTNGWGSNNEYRIVRTSDSAVVRSGTLNDPTKGNMIKKETFCIVDGTYTAQLVLGGSSTSQIGFSISACNIFLDNLLTTASFTLSSNTCGACATNSLDITLVGSVYGIPYGWIDTSAYAITSYNANVDITGTLHVGIIEKRGFCLPDGLYNITFTGVPGEDDFGLNYGTSEGYYGIQEYEMKFSCESADDVTLHAFVCNSYSGKCTRVMQKAIIQLTGGNCDLIDIVNGEISYSGSNSVYHFNVVATLTLVGLSSLLLHILL